MNSALRVTLVLPGKEETRTVTTTWSVAPYDWVQANLCRVQGMLATETNVFVSDFLLPYVRPALNFPPYTTSRLIDLPIFFRGDVLNTTVYAFSQIVALQVNVQ